MYRIVFGLWALATPACAFELHLPLRCDLEHVCAIQQYVDHDASGSSKDYRCGSMAYDGHNGTDFRLPSLAMMRSGVDVLAAAAGQITRRRDGVPDELYSEAKKSMVQGQECGNGVVIAHEEGYETQYCHLAAGTIAVKPGDRVDVGRVLGKVGLSGQTQFPHVHLSVRKNGLLVDPFAPDGDITNCGERSTLWVSDESGQLTYRPGRVLNSGFAGSPVSMESIDEGLSDPPTEQSSAIIAYVRSIGLERGDGYRLTVTGPDGAIFADSKLQTLAARKAQLLVFLGRRRPPEGWPLGLYKAEYTVYRDGNQLQRQEFATELR